MATSEESNLYPGYRRVREVDKYALSQLVLDAIGDKMSQKEFAQNCGLDPSTVSRLITMQYNGTYSEKVVKKIADAVRKYNPESGVTEEKLLDAFGFEKTLDDGSSGRMEESMPQQKTTMGGTRRKRLDAQFSSSARFIISTLVLNKYSVELMSSEEGKDDFRNFELITNALDEQGINYWYFHQVPATFYPGADPMTTLFYRAYLNIESSKRAAYSLISMNPKTMETMVKKYEDTVFHDYLSVILIDADANKILDEFVFQQKKPDNRMKVFCPNDFNLSPSNATKDVTPKVAPSPSIETKPVRARKISRDTGK